MSARRSGGRRAKTESRNARPTDVFDSAWRQWVNPYEPIRQFSDDQIEAIHQASVEVLQETGIKVLSDEARKFYSDSGHKVTDDEVVQFDTDLLIAQVSCAPSEVTFQTRDANRQVTVGGKNVGICTTGGTPCRIWPRQRATRRKAAAALR